MYVADMYVPGQAGLTARDLVRVNGARELPFPFSARHRTFSYMARGVIYHLFRSLNLGRDEVVLVPDYHSGVEVWAMRTAGATLRYYPIRRNLEPDLKALERLCTSDVRVLYVIHFLGWPQPLAALRELCRERGLIMIEDCALSLLSEPGGTPLGTTGEYAVYCLYKSLPVPHGGLLVQNANVFEQLDRLEFESCGTLSLAARGAELLFDSIRGRNDTVGKALFRLKRWAGRGFDALGLRRLAVGDIAPDFTTAGLDVARMNVGMSPWCRHLLRGFDYDAIRRRRRENFLTMRDRLHGAVTLVRDDLAPGVCPMFFPVLVPDKHAAAQALHARGVGAIEFWNYGYPEAERHTSRATRFLRRHLLELPLHQDVTPEQAHYTVDCVLALKQRFKMADDRLDARH